MYTVSKGQTPEGTRYLSILLPPGARTTTTRQFDGKGVELAVEIRMFFEASEEEAAMDARLSEVVSPKR